MTTKPETKFWKRIKDKFTKVTLTRIEAVTPLGLPDVLAVYKITDKDRGQFWIELKVTRGNSIGLSPGQISWHMSHNTNGGKSFIMATPLGRRGISLFSGARALSLAKQGLSLDPCAFFPEPCDFSKLEHWLIDHVP
tara:strand:+ start:882 stop:1292 length:411 start_codon:yes stop_codon:yes gene_type:complete